MEDLTNIVLLQTGQLIGLRAQDRLNVKQVAYTASHEHDIHVSLDFLHPSSGTTFTSVNVL